MSEQAWIPGVEPVLFDKSEAAAFLHTSQRHIERLVEQRALGHCRVGRFVRFREQDLLDYLNRTHVDPEVVQ